MLRVGYFCFPRRKAEKVSIEQIDASEHAVGRNIIRILAEFRGDALGRQLCRAKKGNRLDAIAQVAPELLNIRSARKTSGHADDGDSVPTVVAAVGLHVDSSCFLARF